MVATDLESAVGDFRTVALASFNTGLQQAGAVKPDVSGDDEKTRDKKLAEWDASTAKAKAQMASALQQLAQADVMLSELKGRDSYRVLVGLIATAGTALNNLIVTPGAKTVQEQTQLITAHAALLESLADIAPLALWQKGQASTQTG